MFIRSCFLLFIYFICTSSFAQRNPKLPPNAQAGKCYAKCLLPSRPVQQGIIDTVTYPIYIGKRSRLKTRQVDVLLVPEKTYWTQMKAKGCQSADIEDCLYWSLEVESKAIYKTLNVPRRPDKIPPEDIIYAKFEIPYYRPAVVGGFTEWREVLCGNQVTAKRILSIQRALNSHGYNLEENNNFGPHTKEALIDFQNKNGLPIGSLDLETLKALGVKY